MAIALGGRRRRASGLPRLLHRVLRVPLVAKLIGANVVIVAAAILVQMVVFHGRDQFEIITVLAALAAASLVNLALVRIALRPIQELKDLADRVSRGDFDARGAPSRFADRALIRLGNTVNELLDALAAERERIRELGAEVVYAQDAERARVSRELHDSIAQTLAAVRLQLAAAGGEAQGDVRNRIAAANGLVGSALEAVKNVSYSLHPRVAEDLGLEAALEALATQVRQRSGMDVVVHTSISGPPLPSNVAATLFRVAQEALRNLELHSKSKLATVDVMSRLGSIRIEVSSNGRDSAGETVTATQPCSGLASVKDRVVLAGGRMEIASAPGGGTRVVAEMDTSRNGKGR